MNSTAQLAIEVYQGVVVIRHAGEVIRRFERDETGTAVVNLGDHPEAECADTEPWTRFERCDSYRRGRRVEFPPHVEVWKNNLYTVQVHRSDDGSAYLSIRSNDRHWRHDWRHLQRIKNELLGDDVEAVELYPARSRVVDDANQFHLWALPAGQRFPLGFTSSDPAAAAAGQPGDAGWRQRPLAPADHRPASPDRRRLTQLARPIERRPPVTSNNQEVQCGRVTCKDEDRAEPPQQHLGEDQRPCPTPT